MSTSHLAIGIFQLPMSFFVGSLNMDELSFVHEIHSKETYAIHLMTPFLCISPLLILRLLASSQNAFVA